MTEVSKPDSSSKGKGWVYVIILALGLLAYSFVTGNNPFALLSNIPAGGGLLVCFLLAAAVYIWGERFIKKQSLDGIGAKATRVAFAIASLVVAFIGVTTIMTGNLSVPGMPSWLQTGVTSLGWFGVISLGVIAATLVFGIWRYTKIPGNASAYLFMGVVVFFIFFGGLYVIGMLVAPWQTKILLDAAQTSIQQGTEGLTTPTSPYGHRAIDWQAIGEFNWGKFFGISFFGLCVIGVGIFLLKGNKIVTFVFVIVASLLVFPTAFYYSWTFAVPEEVKEFVTGAATNAYEANPFLGERHTHNLSGLNSGETKTIIDVGPYDDIRVAMPRKVCRFAGPNGIMPSAGWLARFGSEPWFDPNTFIKRTNSSPDIRTYELSEQMKKGMKDADTTVDITFTLTCQQ